MSVTKASYYQRQVKKGKISQSQYNKIMTTPAKGKTVKKTTRLTTSRDPYAGMDWGTAASRAKASGVDTSTGSAFDLSMNKKYNPENYAKLTSRGTPDSYGVYPDGSYDIGGKTYQSGGGGSNRQKAAEASKSPSIGNKIFNTLTGTNTANASSGDRPSAGVISRPTALGRGLEILSDPLGLRPKMSRLFGTETPQNPDFGISEALGLNKYLKGDAMVFNAGNNPLNNPTRNTQDLEEGSLTDEQLQRIVNENAYNDFERQNQIINETGGRITANDIRATGGGGNNRPSPTKNDWEVDPNLGSDPNNENEMNAGDYNNKQLTDYLNAVSRGTKDYTLGGDNQIYDTTPDNTPTQQDNRGTVPKTYGAGAFGTGKGISNMGMDDETKAYIKQLRKSAGGDFGMKDAKKQIENLLNSLNIQYGEEERLGKNTLDKGLFQNLLGLGGRFNQANTGDSEQRMQYEQLARSENQNSLGEFLARLASSKSQDVLQTKNKGLDLFSQIADKKRTAQEKLLDYIKKAKERQEDMALNWYRAMKKGSSDDDNNTTTGGTSFEDLKKELGLS